MGDAFEDIISQLGPSFGSQAKLETMLTNLVELTRMGRVEWVWGQSEVEADQRVRTARMGVYRVEIVGDVVHLLHGDERLSAPLAESHTGRLLFSLATVPGALAADRRLRSFTRTPTT
jgi:hypothetical protein